MKPLLALVGLAPVVLFLGVLVVLDSYQLVSRRSVGAAIAIGGAAALVAAGVNTLLLERLGIGYGAYARYAAPLVEEVLKAVWVIRLIRSHRVGFLVDAAILAFAVGTGFALVENVVLLARTPPTLLLWIARGFGTAILHGSTTVILALISKAVIDRHGSAPLLAFGPGLAAAAALHSLYNHFVLPPLVTAGVLLGALPALVVLVFERSEKATRSWLGEGFDADLEILERIEGGRVAESPIGQYLEELRSHFPGPVVADMLCLLQIHHELGIRAKGMLIAREAGFDIPPDESVRANLAELSYLERSIGRTGRLALRPVLKSGGRDRWQLEMLGS